MHDKYLDVSCENLALDEGTERLLIAIPLNALPSMERTGLGVLGGMTLRHRTNAMISDKHKKG